MILKLIDNAVNSGARLKKAASTIGLSSRTINRWKGAIGEGDKRKGPKSEPSNKLSKEERQHILDVANSAPFRDLSPKQIVPKLADQGTYIASESSFYRVLREHEMISHRQKSQPAVHHRPKAHVADGPCQVWSWDITYLHSPVKGSFYYLYMVIDVWSRKVVGATVFGEESMDLGARHIVQTCAVHNIQREGLVLHSDNGGPMKGSTMLATLQKLGIVPSFSRPKVSDDNPFSESLFRTMKYRPEYPSKCFNSIEHAQQWVDQFVNWYNTCHQHSAIRFVTPDDRHYGREQGILANRKNVYEQARMKRPGRWTKDIRNWEPVALVWLNPEKSSSIKDSFIDKKAA